MAREHIGRGADLVIAAGGDGTINEAAEGMIHSPVPLAILPARHGQRAGHGDETRARAWSEPPARLDELEPRRIAVGRLTCDGGGVSRHFLLMAGIGLDAHIVYHVSAGLKARTGKFAYWLAGWSLLGRRLAQFQAELGGEPRSSAPSRWSARCGTTAAILRSPAA